MVSLDHGTVYSIHTNDSILVAMTRPKRHLCVICDTETLSGVKATKKNTIDGGFLKRWMDWLNEEADLRFSEQ